MSLTEKQQQLYDAVTTRISRRIRFPMRLKNAAEKLAIPWQEFKQTLREMWRKRAIDKEIDRRVQVQEIIDGEFVRSTHLVSAPLLTADEIRRGDYLPGKDERPFVTLALPKEFAGSTGRYCCFQVMDEIMAKRHIHKYDLVICSIGQMPRHNAPVLCVLPGGNVCVRSFFTNNTGFFELGTPERKDIQIFSYYYDWPVVVGVIVSVQTFILSWEGAGAKHISELPENQKK